ncbi:MAG TPA: contact-dependent growth inhibition system immunity protein [Polyangiaceae bacterium]|nr:contact-dependent growth inhibition system immunity protein [Polyangiaceae bacterium]
MSSQSFPSFAQLLGGWFHGDFDLEGDTLEGIVASYKDATEADEVSAVKQEGEKIPRVARRGA